jgi:capsular exopolysaccharide synthesis family protein
LLCGVDKPVQVLAITSSFESEGKSTIASNLAVALAQGGANVLLADCDLRRGRLHQCFGLDRVKGITTLLTGTSGSESYVQPLPELPNFSVVGCGPSAPNPGELLSSKRMQELIREWRNSYDHVVIDTAPILPVADSVMLLPHSEAVLLVIRARVTRRKAVLRARESLMRAGSRIAGIVLNDVDLKIEHYYTYNRYGYGYKRGSYGSAYYTDDES